MRFSGTSPFFFPVAIQSERRETAEKLTIINPHAPSIPFFCRRGIAFQSQPHPSSSLNLRNEIDFLKILSYIIAIVTNSQE
jgi:hypothetical protein